MIIKEDDPRLRSVAAKLIKSQIAEVLTTIDNANKIHAIVAEQADQLNKEVRAAIDKANKKYAAMTDRLDRTDRAVDLLRQEAAEAQAQRVREIKQARTQGDTELREVARQVKQLRGTVERLLLASADRGNRGE